MRKRQTFLLTILTPDNGEASVRGRVKVISSGKSSNFTSIEELYHLLMAEMDDDTLQRLAAHSNRCRCESQSPA